MDRTYQPAKRNFRNNKLNTFKGTLGTGPIIEQEEDTGDDLHRKQKQRHAAEVIPDRMSVLRHFFLRRHRGDSIDPESFVKPKPDGLKRQRGPKLLKR